MEAGEVGTAVQGAMAAAQAMVVARALHNGASQLDVCEHSVQHSGDCENQSWMKPTRQADTLAALQDFSSNTAARLTNTSCSTG